MAAERQRIATDEEMAEDAIATATEATEHTKVVVESGGREYVLEFSRETVKRMEAQGFDVDSIASAPMTTIEALVVGAFEMHHQSMSRAARLQVWSDLGGKSGEDGLVAVLARLYMVPVNSLVADPTEATATWRLA